MAVHSTAHRHTRTYLNCNYPLSDIQLCCTLHTCRHTHKILTTLNDTKCGCTLCTRTDTHAHTLSVAIHWMIKSLAVQCYLSVHIDQSNTTHTRHIYSVLTLKLQLFFLNLQLLLPNQSILSFYWRHHNSGAFSSFSPFLFLLSSLFLQSIQSLFSFTCPWNPWSLYSILRFLV